MKTCLKQSAALFAAGFFFGGVVDHLIFALRGESAPYGFHLGRVGNWLMMAFDAVVTGLLLFIGRRPSGSER